MESRLGRTFLTIIRRVDALREIIDSDPYCDFHLPARAKRVVTFLQKRSNVKLALPIELDGVQILCSKGREIFTAYVPSPRGPIFMTLIERTLGKEVTTRTWDTVKKVAK